MHIRDARSDEAGLLGSIQDFTQVARNDEPRRADGSAWQFKGASGRDALVAEIKEKWPRVTNPMWGTPFDFLDEW